MSYHLENKFGHDKFGIHTKISETLFEIIEDEDLDLSEGSFTIGLFGKWGSGKSLILDKLKKDFISSNSGVVYIYLDVWKYINTSLYRSILFDVEKELKTSNNWHVCQKFKEDGYLYEGQSLKDILDRDIKVEEDDPNSKENDKSKLQKFGEFLKKYWIFTTILVLILTTKILSDIHNWEGVKDILGYLFQFFIVIGGIKVFEEVFSDIGKGFVSKQSIRVVSTPPTFSQDQFENIFKDMIQQSLNSINSQVKTKRVVIVFDNLDRCEPKLSYQTLTGLRTFMESKNCIYIIPCDDKEIHNHLNSNTKGIPVDFMDKIFQTYLRIPVLEEFDRDDFIDNLLKDCIVPIQEESLGTVKSILYRGYKGQTPRQIKRFINDYETYYRLMKNIDPKEKVLLKDLNIFTFFVVIKQVYPEVESLFIKYPDFFSSEGKEHPIYSELEIKCSEEGKTEEHSNRTRLNFEFFMESFGKRLKLKEIQEPLNYVFLKTDIRYDIIRLKQGLLDLNEEIDFTPESPILINRILDTFLDKKENVFLEDSITFLSKLIYSSPLDIVMNDIFKVIWKFRDKVPKEIIYGNVVVLLSKFESIKLIGTKKERTDSYIKIIKYLFTSEIETIKEFQDLFDLIIPEIEPKDFIKCFDLDIEQKINEVDDEISNPLPYLLSTNIGNIRDYIPIEYINQLFSQLTFDHDTDDEILDILKHYKEENGRLTKEVSLILSERISKKLIEINRNTQSSEVDKNIIKLCKQLKEDIIYSDEFCSSLYNKVMYSIGHNVPESSHDYFPISLNFLGGEQYQPNLISQFNNSVVFKNETYFTQFIDSLDEFGIELFLVIDDQLTTPFLTRINNQNLWEKLHSKLSPSFILDYFPDLIQLNEITSYISLIERIDELNDSRLNDSRTVLVGNLLSLDIESSREYIDDVILLSNNDENRLNYIIRVLEFLFSNVTNEQDDICKYLDKLKSLKNSLNRKHKSSLSKQVNSWKTTYKNVKYIVRVNNRLKNFNKK